MGGSIDDEMARWRSVGEFLEAHATRFGSRTAFSFFRGRMSFGRTLASAHRFARVLQAAGVGKGDRVAIMMPNCLQYPVALLGTLLAGAVVVNTNPLYTARELHHQLVDSGAVVLLLAEISAPAAAGALAGTDVRLVITTGLGDLVGGLRGFLVSRGARRRMGVGDVGRLLPGAIGWRRAMRRGGGPSPALPAVGPEDLAFLQYTGGTTGVAKGAMLTHRNIVANVLQSREVMRPVLSEDGTVGLALLPMYHVFALTLNAFALFIMGGESVLVANPRDVRSLLRVLGDRPFDGMCGTNTLFANLLDDPDWCARDFSRLKLVVSGGMPLARAVAERWHAVTGVPITEGYGLTEASPVLTADRIEPRGGARPAFTGTVGRPLASTEIRLRRADGSWAGTDEVGEICARGPQVMRGYWRQAEETARVLDADGWLATGDVGRIDAAGCLAIVDRVKDVIIVSGFNVYPTEIEEVVAAHPGVRECAAVGIADEAAGERVRLIVVRADPAVTRGDIIAHCRVSLTGYKIPVLVEFSDMPLPRSPVGKLLRRALPPPSDESLDALREGQAVSGRTAKSVAG